MQHSHVALATSQEQHNPQHLANIQNLKMQKLPGSLIQNSTQITSLVTGPINQYQYQQLKANN